MEYHVSHVIMVYLGSDPANGMFDDGDVVNELSSGASTYTGTSAAYGLIGGVGFIIGSILSWAMKKWVTMDHLFNCI